MVADAGQGVQAQMSPVVVSPSQHAVRNESLAFHFRVKNFWERLILLFGAGRREKGVGFVLSNFEQKQIQHTQTNKIAEGRRAGAGVPLSDHAHVVFLVVCLVFPAPG